MGREILCQGSLLARIANLNFLAGQALLDHFKENKGLREFRREIKIQAGEEKWEWCERGDLNPYGLPHWILSPFQAFSSYLLTFLKYRQILNNIQFLENRDVGLTSPQSWYHAES